MVLTELHVPHDDANADGINPDTNVDHDAIELPSDDEGATVIPSDDAGVASKHDGSCRSTTY